MSAQREVRRSVPKARWADWFDWMESGMPMPTARPFDTKGTMRFEDYMEDDHYVLRAELPGLDPDRDVSVTVDEGVLTITAERSESIKDRQRSEFYYGSMSRSVRLPKGADGEAVEAHYADGILTVRVAMTHLGHEHVTVPIKKA